MSKFGLVLSAAFFLAVFMSAGAQATNICDLMNIPYFPTVNRSMILIIPTDEVNQRLASLGEPLKISWDVRYNKDHDYAYQLVHDYAWGSMQRYNDCYICEFSGDRGDFDGDCGPVPITEPGVYDVTFYANSFSKMVEFNRSLEVRAIDSIGALEMIMTVDDDVVHVTADVPVTTNQIWINVYDKATGDTIPGYEYRSLNSTSVAGRYMLDIVGLEPGDYYASLGFRTTYPKTGGTLMEFRIEESQVEVEVNTEKADYWIGEKVIISGKTKYGSVSGSVSMPGGNKISLPKKTVTDGEYSYEFDLLNSYSTGNYTITIDAGELATAQKGINVARLFRVGKTSLTFDFQDSTTEIVENITVFNEVNESVTLSATTEGVTGFAVPVLAKNILGSKSTTTLTVTGKPQGLTGEKTGIIYVSSVDEGVSIPIEVTLTKEEETPKCQTECDTGALSVLPVMVKFSDCVEGEVLNETLTIKNLGDEVINSFEHKPSGLDVEDAEFPDSLDPGSEGSLVLSINAERGFDTGSIEISGGGSKVKVYVSMNCIEDVSDDVYTLADDVDALKADYSEAGFGDDSIYNIFYFLDMDVKSAQDSLDLDEYDSAKVSYASALASYEALDGLLTGIEGGDISAGGDCGWATGTIIILVIALVAVLGFFVYDKFGSKLFSKSGDSGQPGESGEESYEEELY